MVTKLGKKDRMPRTMCARRPAGSNQMKLSMTTTAGFVIEFLGNLRGMDRLQSLIEDQRSAVIDLTSTAIIEADPEWSGGEFLLYERANGTKCRVRTRKLVPPLILRHASEVVIAEGGTVREHYQRISLHFHHKTGIGL